MSRIRSTQSASAASPAPAAQPIKKVFSIKELVQVVGRSRTSIYADIARGQFPKPIATGPKSRRWLCEEVFQWIEARRQERDRAVA